MNTLPLIRAEKTGKKFSNGLVALENIDLEIKNGEFVAIVGPSGCGKSTLLRLLAGLDTATTGHLTLDNCTPLEARRTRQDLAYVFQDATLLPWRTVSANVALPLELQNKSNNLADKDKTAYLSVDQALEMVGIGDFGQAYPGQLSGGMHMRASIARALITHPDLLLMDEPFGALDEITRQHLNEELFHLWLKDRWTCVFITHNVSDAIFLSQRILVMSPRPGRIVAELPVPFGNERTLQLRTSAEFNQFADHVSIHLNQRQPL